MNNGLADRIDAAKKQAPNIIIDARAQRGLTREAVRETLRTSFLNATKTSSKSVVVLGRDTKGAFEIKVTRP